MLAGAGHHLAPQEVVHGRAVLQAVRAAVHGLALMGGFRLLRQRTPGTARSGVPGAYSVPDQYTPDWMLPPNRARLAISSAASPVVLFTESSALPPSLL
jgi:hypothetical protein